MPVVGAYRLPDGLNEGDRVKLIAFEPGYWAVEKDGRQFTVSMAGIQRLTED
jgi:hypothetical protein